MLSSVVYYPYMDEQLSKVQEKLLEVQAVVEETNAAMRKLSTYAKWTAIITIAVIVIPLLIIPLLIPAFLASVALPPGF